MIQLEDTVEVLNLIFSIMNKWLIANKLTLNLAKTRFIEVVIKAVTRMQLIQKLVIKIPWFMS